MLNPNPSPPSSIQTLKLKPQCLDYCLFLPFPFFCMGCFSCLNVTAIFNYEQLQRVVRLNVYPGLMVCCSKQYKLQLSEIQGISPTLVPDCRINKQPAYELRLETSQGSIVLTGAKMYGEILSRQEQVEAFLNQCRSASDFRF